ncbi:perilipin-1 isoform X2 [Ctenopharyngodon idella]|uniref:perilipin-1 isoform X2 n=1 Tax=Ctenopharyngodon idella TaxID=7959 RepID=UPI002232B352|nr:perilipin-1 isoform X2 [Ctenopharyngodon idella]
MASEKKDTGEVLKDQNVFLRILNLRSVNAALESIEKMYISTKQSHPIIRSVCGLYEKGVSRAGSLALWSMQPALHVLEPQLIAANSMACRGLDRLEEKVPALQSPPAELTANIKELMSSTLETAKDGITGPIKHTSNVVLGKVSTGYQQSKNAISNGIQYVLNSKLVYLAEQRANRALSVTENLFEYVLPVSSAETEDDGSMGEQAPDVGASGPKPSFSRLRELAGTICRRAFEKTAAQLQRSKRQGQELVTQIPGVSPLVEYTMKTMKTLGGVILGLPSSVAAFLKDGQQHSPQNESNGLPSLVSGLGQQLLKVYESVVANVEKTPQTNFNLAKDGVNIVLGYLGTVRERALHNLSYYGLIPRRSSKPEGRSQLVGKDGAEECLSGSLVLESNVGDHMHRPSDNSEKQPLKTTEPKEISEETRQLKKKVMKQIPVQQKVVLGGSNKKLSNHMSSRKSLTDCTQISSSSSNTCTVQNSRNAE